MANEQTMEDRRMPEDRRRENLGPPQGGERRKRIADRRSANNLKYATFRIGDEHFGIDVQRVQEVLLSQGSTLIPLVNPSIKGLVNLRGQVVPIFDLRLILGYAPLVDDPEPVMAVLNHKEGLLGFLFDIEDDYLEIDPSYFHLAPSNLSPNISDKVRGVCEMPGAFLIILDVDAVFDSIQ
jgi:purine-binding chemotaxis protein CheW